VRVGERAAGGFCFADPAKVEECQDTTKLHFTAKRSLGAETSASVSNRASMSNIAQPGFPFASS